MTGKISLFKSKNYKVTVSIEINSSDMRPIVRDFDTGAFPQLIRAEVLDQSWLDNISQCDMLEIRNAFKMKLFVSRATTLYPHMGESYTRVTFGVVDEFAVSAVFGTVFIDSFIKLIHPGERMILSYQSAWYLL